MAKPQGRTPRVPEPLVPLENNNTDLRSPRISWSVLIMGIGVVVSIVLNYAAYDTRIAVLEKAVLSNEKMVVELRHGIRTLETQFSVLQAQQSGAVSKITANVNEVNQLEKEVGKIDDRLRVVETTKGKP